MFVSHTPGAYVCVRVRVRMFPPHVDQIAIFYFPTILLLEVDSTVSTVPCSSTFGSNEYSIVLNIHSVPQAFWLLLLLLLQTLESLSRNTPRLFADGNEGVRVGSGPRVVPRLRRGRRGDGGTRKLRLLLRPGKVCGPMGYLLFKMLTTRTWLQYRSVVQDAHHSYVAAVPYTSPALLISPTGSVKRCSTPHRCTFGGSDTRQPQQA